MMNKILSVVKFLLILIFIVFIITITTYSLVMIFGYDSADSSQWISFLGSIIGGSLTLVGVAWTIRYEKEERENKLKLDYRPVIYSDENEEIYAFIEDDSYKLKNQKSEKIIKFLFTIENKGRGEACSIIINPKGNLKFIGTNGIDLVNIDILPKNGTKKVEFRCIYEKDIESKLHNLAFDVSYNSPFEDGLETEFVKTIKINNKNENRASDNNLNIFPFSFLKKIK